MPKNDQHSGFGQARYGEQGGKSRCMRLLVGQVAFAELVSQVRP